MLNKNKVQLSIFLLSIFTIVSCSIYKTNRLNKYIDENLKNITIFPDDYLHPKGDIICERILNKGTDITPFLISKIDDTTNSNYIYAGSFRYKVGDIAFFLIDNLYSDKELPIRKMLEDKFYKERTDFPFFLTLYHEIFFLNSEKQNFKNRKRLKKILNKRYQQIYKKSKNDI